MPPEKPMRKSKRQIILQNATAAMEALGDVAEVARIPFISSVSSLASNILSLSESVKTNKEECLQMVDHIQELLWAVVDLCVRSNTDGVLPPAVLTKIGNFARMLQKIHTFMSDQAKMGKIQRFLRQGENSQLLNDCKAGLGQALQDFSVQYSATTVVGLSDLQLDEATRHADLLALIASHSDNGSSIDGGRSIFKGSSTSLLLLPGRPKIFHGRDRELQTVVDAILTGFARVAILGSGGVGKTSLATAIMHHPDIAGKFAHRHFVLCDSAVNHGDLFSIVASHLQLEPSQSSPKDIVGHLCAAPATLLVLDNLETPWEPTSSRDQVEEFLALLTEIPDLSLLITMRGTERPRKVSWSRPFLPPLRPLTEAAARQTFFDIADDAHDNAGVSELLRLTDYLPLAVSLLAHIVSFEGAEAVLRRWKEESTTLLSEGHDKRSNLGHSIMLSLSSPRILSVPGAQDLLSVVSLLPDGISYPSLIQMSLPISDIGTCRAALIRTSLAYIDHDGRLKVLSPIREYMRSSRPPTLTLMCPVRNHLGDVLMLWKTFRQLSDPDCIPQITFNLANFRSVLHWGLQTGDHDDLSATIRSILTLDSFTRAIGRGTEDLMRLVPQLLEQCDNHQLHGEYINARFEHYEFVDIPDPDSLEVKGINEFKLAHDPVGEVQFYNVLGSWYLVHDDFNKGKEYFTRALLLATESKNLIGQGKALIHFAEVEWEQGNYRTGQKYAAEARRVMKPTGHLIATAHAIDQEVLCLYALGDFSRSLELCNDARQILAVCRMEGSPLDVCFMSSLGDIHFLKTEYAESRAMHLQILNTTSTSRQQSPSEYAHAFLHIAAVDLAMGADEQTVRKSLDTAREVFVSMQFGFSISQCDMVLADLQLRQGHKADARRFYETRFAQNRDRSGVVIECLHQLGDPTHWHGMCNPETTLGYAMALVGYTRNGGSQLEAHHALRCLGDIFLADGDADTARNLFTAALQGFTAMGVHLSIAQCSARLNGIANQAAATSLNIGLLN
ncbi:hypothetical protein FB451DRAFT_1081691 [Mycena latifolia]|nr:hypothetical protein FB451DRAFT_1081691 [Mycena latifolia]